MSQDADRRVTRRHLFILCLWKDSGSAWRISLEDAHSGERHGFASTTPLVEFLKEVMEEAQSNIAESDTAGYR